MDITLNYCLSQIRNSSNKKHWRVKSFIKQVDDEISGLRLTYFKMRGSKIAFLCNRRANDLEKELKGAMACR